jgi:hypothetical protein
MPLTPLMPGVDETAMGTGSVGRIAAVGVIPFCADCEDTVLTATGLTGNPDIDGKVVVIGAVVVVAPGTRVARGMTGSGVRAKEFVADLVALSADVDIDGAVASVLADDVAEAVAFNSPFFLLDVAAGLFVEAALLALPPLAAGPLIDSPKLFFRLLLDSVFDFLDEGDELVPFTVIFIGTGIHFVFSA